MEKWRRGGGLLELGQTIHPPRLVGPCVLFFAGGLFREDANEPPVAESKSLASGSLRSGVTAIGRSHFFALCSLASPSLCGVFFSCRAGFVHTAMTTSHLSPQH